MRIGAVYIRFLPMMQGKYSKLLQKNQDNPTQQLLDK